jgi:hypothetical protein
LIEAQAEGVSGGVEHNPDVRLRLVFREGGSQGHRFGDGRVQVRDLEVEVHHRALLPVDGRPDRRAVAVGLLEHEVRSLRGGGDDRRSRLLVSDVPPEEFGVELRQATGVRCLDRRPPPHAGRSRSHARSLPHDRGPVERGIRQRVREHHGQAEVTTIS